MRDPHFPYRCFLIVSLFCFLQSAFAADAPVLRFTVESADHARLDTPISIDLSNAVLPDRQLLLCEMTDKACVFTPYQIERSTPPRLHFILAGSTPAHTKRTYELVLGKPFQPSQLTLQQDDKVLEIRRGDKSILRYNHAPVPPPPGQSPLYTRSGFIHPLWTPAGQILTRIHPPDHYHHLGLWNPWTNTTFEGRHVDFWNLKDALGTVRFTQFASTASGPVYASFRAQLDYIDLKAPGGEKVALKEDLDIRVWNVAKDGYLFDFTTTQRCATTSPLELNQYRYGGIGLRFTEHWKQGNTDVLTSEGKDRKAGNGTRSRWAIVYGDSPQGPAGIVFMSHPQNHIHPEPMRIWPEGDMFFNYCPVVDAPWTLKSGNNYVLKYRLYVYDGKITPEAADRLWQDFAHPPKITMEK